MKLHYQASGAGQPVLILHGLFGSLDNWHSIRLRLSEDFHVYAVDLRNHGLSPHSPEMDYDVMARDLGELIDAQGLDRVSLIGHSLGGKVAMEFALSFPELVEKLIIVDIAPRTYPPHHDEIFRALLALDLDRFTSRHQIEAELEDQIPELTVRRFLLKNLKRDSSGAFHWQIDLPALRENYSQLLVAPAAGRVCDRPALFLRGEKSDFVTDADERLIRRLFSRAEIRTIPNAKHWVHADVPESFLRNVHEFFRD